jgi:hypothetical protein
LSKNTLGYAGLLCFTEAVTQSNTLEYLNLSDNEGIKDFMAQITPNSQFKTQYSTKELVFIKTVRSEKKKSSSQSKKTSSKSKKNTAKKKRKSVPIKGIDDDDEGEGLYDVEDYMSSDSFRSEASCDPRIEKNGEEINHLKLEPGSSKGIKSDKEILKVKMQNEKLREMAREMAKKMKAVEEKNLQEHKKTESMIDELQRSVEHLATLVEEIEYSPKKDYSSTLPTTGNTSPTRDIIRRLSEMWNLQNDYTVQ